MDWCFPGHNTMKYKGKKLYIFSERFGKQNDRLCAKHDFLTYKFWVYKKIIANVY